MKKLFVVLSLAWALQAPAVSISSKLNGQQQAGQQKKADIAAKVIVVSACQDLFPALQEVLMANKADIKDLVKLQLGTMRLNKELLHSLKDIVNQGAPLSLDGFQVLGALLKKHGKDAIGIYKKTTAQMIASGARGGLVDNFADQEALEGIFDLIAEDEKLNEFLQKTDSFNHTVDNFVLALREFQTNRECDAKCDNEEQDEQALMQLRTMQALLQKIFVNALSNKRVIGIQTLIMNMGYPFKTQADVLYLVQAGLTELEPKLPQLILSADKFVQFATPFLAAIVTESIDETLQAMPA